MDVVDLMDFMDLMDNGGDMSSDKGSIHYARFIKSKRLQRLLDFLLDGKEHTTMEIIQGADVCAVNSAVCELRRNGFSAYCINRGKPAIYKLTNPEADRLLAAQLLGKLEAVEHYADHVISKEESRDDAR